MSTKSITAIIIVLALIALGGIYYITKNSPSNTEKTQNENVSAPTTETKEEPGAQKESEEKEEYVVIYTDSGFSSEITKIKIGETVIFKNESAGEMWVVSAPHPIHTAYPEFDAKRGYKKGENYSFTFTKKGEWKYHDHLIAAHRGTVVVE